MEDFQKRKSYGQQSTDQPEAQNDRYLEDLRNRLRSKQQGSMISDQLDEFHYEQDNAEERASSRAKSLRVVWSGVLFSAVNCSLLYPKSVRLVKKVFRLQSFWNIHFAVFSILFMWNSICLGILTGGYQAYLFKERIARRDYLNE